MHKVFREASPCNDVLADALAVCLDYLAEPQVHYKSSTIQWYLDSIVTRVNLRAPNGATIAQADRFWNRLTTNVKSLNESKYKLDSEGQPVDFFTEGMD